MYTGSHIDVANSMNILTSKSGLLHERLKSQQLVLISGCTGTGKSTLGMEISLSRGILRCISTLTIRQVMRTYSKEPAIHRSSYSGVDDPIKNWLETCKVLEDGIENVVEDCLKRGTSLVLEGVHIVPSEKLINKWRDAGGTALGVVLTIPDANVHKEIIQRREVIRATEELENFDRIRSINDEMVRLGKLEKWLLIEQKPMLEPRPIDLLNNELNQVWFDGYSRSILNNIIR